MTMETMTTVTGGLRAMVSSVTVFVEQHKEFEVEVYGDGEVMVGRVWNKEKSKLVAPRRDSDIPREVYDTALKAVRAMKNEGMVSQSTLEKKSPTLAERVDSALRGCLYDAPTASANDAVVVEGIVNKFGFDPASIARNRAEIECLIDEIVPDVFYRGSGDEIGMSFLQLCDDKHGQQWTGMHQTMEALYVLAAAIGRARFCLPREFWGALPGGMPYIQFDRASAKEQRGSWRAAVPAMITELRDLRERVQLAEEYCNAMLAMLDGINNGGPQPVAWQLVERQERALAALYAARDARAKVGGQ